MSVKLLTEHHLDFQSLTGGCTGSSESTLVKMPHCWKSHVAAQMSRSCDDEPLAMVSLFRPSRNARGDGGELDVSF